MAVRTLTAVHREDDLFVAECPEMGTVSQGYTVEEAIANLKEGTELYLEEFPLRVQFPFQKAGNVSQRVPLRTSFLSHQ